MTSFPVVQYGDEVEVYDARGEWLTDRVALSGIEVGRNFPVVWVKRMGQADDSAVPWPAEDVRRAPEIEDRRLTELGHHPQWKDCDSGHPGRSHDAWLGEEPR